MHDDHIEKQAAEDLLLKNEENVVLLPMIDTYQNITKKVKLGIDWVVKNTQAKWIMKVDSDAYVQVDAINDYLKRFDAEQYVVIGRIVNGVKVKKSSKDEEQRWVDTKYAKGKHYPQYCSGAAGYSVLEGNVFAK